VRQRITALKREINEIREHRRRSRQRRTQQALPLAALVGYTNVGKSTLLSRLTGSEAVAADAPFVTLDPLTRLMELPGGQHVLISDTVGFISKLPPTVVAAFRATLEELRDATVLIHVVDVTDPRAPECNAVVHDILRQLDLDDKPMITALNKVDAIPGEGDGAAGDLPPLEQPPDADTVLVSAQSGLGIEALRGRIAARIDESTPWLAARVPYSRTDLVDLFHRRGHPTRVEYQAEGTEIEGRIPARFVERFRPYILNESAAAGS
jgi:GTP-binding protein HflX